MLRVNKISFNPKKANDFSEDRRDHFQLSLLFCLNKKHREKIMIIGHGVKIGVENQKKQSTPDSFFFFNF